MNTVRCIYILEHKHLLILVNIWLLFIWYICTYAAVMQLCSEPRWQFLWYHVFALIKQTDSLSYTDDHKYFMSFIDALSSFDILDVELTQSVDLGVEHVLSWFWNIPVVFHDLVVWRLHTNFKGLWWSVRRVFSCILTVNQYHLL